MFSAPEGSELSSFPWSYLANQIPWPKDLFAFRNTGSRKFLLVLQVQSSAIKQSFLNFHVLTPAILHYICGIRVFFYLRRGRRRKGCKPSILMFVQPILKADLEIQDGAYMLQVRQGDILPIDNSCPFGKSCPLTSHIVQQTS